MYCPLAYVTNSPFRRAAANTLKEFRVLGFGVSGLCVLGSIVCKGSGFKDFEVQAVRASDLLLASLK